MHAVGRDDQVGALDAGVLDPGLEPHLDAEFPAPVLEDAEQRLPRDPGEGLPAGADDLPPVADVDGVPEDEPLGDVDEGAVVGLAELAEGPVGEDHAPAVGGAGGILLVDGDLAVGVGPLEQEAGVQAAGAAPEGGDAHAYPTTSASRSNCERSLTAGIITSSSQPSSA